MRTNRDIRPNEDFALIRGTGASPHDISVHFAFTGAKLADLYTIMIRTGNHENDSVEDAGYTFSDFAFSAAALSALAFASAAALALASESDAADAALVGAGLGVSSAKATPPPREHEGYGHSDRERLHEPRRDARHHNPSSGVVVEMTRFSNACTEHALKQRALVEHNFTQ